MSEDDLGSGTEDALRRLEAQLTRASDAAERLIIEVAEGVAARSGPAEAGGSQDAAPPGGWQTPGGDRRDRRSQDLAVLLGLLDRVRELIPPDLQRRLAEALRELLLAVRAVIDWYLERVERRRAAPVEVTDIPID